LLLAILPWPVHAHPMGKWFPVHKTELLIEADAARLDYTLLIPTDWVVNELRAEGGDPDTYTQDKLQELQDSVLLRQDGTLLHWSAVPLDEETGLGNRSNFEYRLRLVADLIPGAADSFTLTVTSYPDTHSFFNHTVSVDPIFVATGSSLFSIEDGRARFDENGQWRAEDRLREVMVLLERGGPMRTLTLGDAPMLLGDAVAGDPWDALDEGRLLPGLGGVLVAVSGLLGALGGLAGPSATTALSRGVPVVLAAVALVTFGGQWLVASAGGLAFGNGVAAALCAVVGAWRWRRSWPDPGLLGLGVALGALACHGLGLSLMLLEVFAVCLLMGSLWVAVRGAPGRGGLLAGWLAAVGLGFLALVLGWRGWGLLTEQLNTLTG